jgi:hypothetical protein
MVLPAAKKGSQGEQKPKRGGNRGIGNQGKENIGAASSGDEAGGVQGKKSGRNVSKAAAGKKMAAAREISDGDDEAEEEEEEESVSVTISSEEGGEHAAAELKSKQPAGATNKRTKVGGQQPQAAKQAAGKSVEKRGKLGARP